MKATGIVRRIDELGRVVIPKEIRRTLRIREGDPLEIFTEREGNIILKKYSPIGELNEYANQFTEAISRALGKVSLICDKDMVIAAAGTNKKDYFEKPISRAMQTLIENRQALTATETGNVIPVVEGEDAKGIYSEVLVPIISEGHTIGAVGALSKRPDVAFSAGDIKALEVAAAFLGAQMEQ